MRNQHANGASFSHRLARIDDRPALEALIDASIRELLKPHLNAA
jgi:hypothetical protein